MELAYYNHLHADYIEMRHEIHLDRLDYDYHLSLDHHLFAAFDYKAADSGDNHPEMGPQEAAAEAVVDNCTDQMPSFREVASFSTRYRSRLGR